MKNLLRVGTSKKSVKESSKAILSIMDSDSDESVKIEALRTLSTLCNVNGTTISECKFNCKDK